MQKEAVACSQPSINQKALDEWADGYYAAGFSAIRYQDKGL